MRVCGHCGEVFYPKLPYKTHPGPAVVERYGRALCEPCFDEYDRIYRRRERETETLLREFANAWSDKI
jgi:hypothetical protein